MDKTYDWPRYLELVSGTTVRKAIGKAAGVSESAASRWLNGETRPTNAVHVAKFAQTYGRNPLEAFIAAGLLSIEQASKALDLDARRMLREVEVSAGSETLPTQHLGHVAARGEIEGPGENDI